MYTLLEMGLFFCMLYTGKQMSFCHFTQFCNVTKIYIEIAIPFIYNVTNWVFEPIWKQRASRKE